jgi:hypothetical protein
LPGAGKKPVCPACGSRLTVRICRECGFSTDLSAGAKETLSISLVGATGSGKSCMLATMLHELGGDFGRLHGAALYPTGGDRTMSQYERLYHTPLYEQGICVPATDEEIDPLTWALVFGGQENAGRALGLTLYDSCGATFKSEQQMSRYNRSLYHSSAIFFLIDPRQFPAPREALGKGRRKKTAAPVEDNPQKLLLRTIHLIRAGLSMEGVDKKLPMPIAVCLTKMDTMFPFLDKASFLADPSRHLRRPMLSATDFSSCDLETRSLIESWGGREFIAHVESQFTKSAFFGLSSLGGQPGSRNEILRVAPHRVLDPLLWLMWKGQVLKTG